MNDSSNSTPIDPLYYRHTFSSVVNRQDRSDLSPIAAILYEDFDELSNRLNDSVIQEACTVRNVLKTRKLAQLVFQEDGDLNLNAIKEAVDLLKNSMYRLGPEGELDIPRDQHLLTVLETVLSNVEVQKAIRALTAPYQNPTADRLIRETLQLPSKTAIGDIHARQACLSAWMCFLRQNVGSCFATAPAILIHIQQPMQMLIDFQELLSTGRLKRVINGVEFSAPLSPSWGAGDSKKVVDIADKKLHRSPGLAKALIAAKIIQEYLSTDEQEKECNVWLERCQAELNRFSSVEEIIKTIVLIDCGLSKREYDEFLIREKQPHTIFQVASTSSRGKDRQFVLFEQKFQEAITQFRLLADNPLLKSWEFTIASFSESKADFTRWNLYASLGFRPEQKGGLGECLHEYLQQLVNECNQKTQELQEDYERAYARLKYAEGRLHNASTEKEIQWMRAEYQSSRNEFYNLEEMRNDYHRKAQRFAHLFNGLINEYDDLFFRYFQEVYDANLQIVSTNPYDDSPAGFRLVYKYGRSNTSQWNFIDTPQEFVECLSQFFSNTELELSSLELLKGIEREFSQIVSTFISHVRSNEFLETAFDRMAQAHQKRPVKDPLNHLDEIEIKPWVYTSGGTMNNLVSAYWKNESKPKDTDRWVENPTELFVFFVDVIKQIPEKISETFKKYSNKRLLVHSPTHAFTLIPGFPLFMEAWSNDSFTYTWIRDQWIKPRKEFVETMILDEVMIESLLELMSKNLPLDMRAGLIQTKKQIFGRRTPIELKRELLRFYPKINADWIDEAFYQYLPLFPTNQFRERLLYLLRECKEIPEKIQQKMLEFYDENPVPYTLERYSPIYKLLDAAKALYCLAIGKPFDRLNIHSAILESARRLGYTYPEPIQIGDSNWVKDYFAFLVNPGTGELDLWRVDFLGGRGHPVYGWRHWLDGSNKSPTWGVYSDPLEYTSKYSLF